MHARVAAPAIFTIWALAMIYNHLKFLRCSLNSQVLQRRSRPKCQLQCQLPVFASQQQAPLSSTGACPVNAVLVVVVALIHPWSLPPLSHSHLHMLALLLPISRNAFVLSRKVLCKLWYSEHTGPISVYTSASNAILP